MTLNENQHMKNRRYSASMGLLIVLACVGAYAQVAEVESVREGEEITYGYDPNIKMVPKEKIPFAVVEKAQITEPGISRVFWFPLSKLFNISEKGAYRLSVQGVVVNDMGEEFSDFRKQVFPVVEGTIKVEESLLEEMKGCE